MLTAAPKPTMAAAIPRPTSTGLTLRTVDAAAGRGAGMPCEGAPGGLLMVEPVLVGGRAAGAPAAGAGAAEVGGRGGAGATEDPVGVETPMGECADGPVGAPEGKVGSLMVGDEEGLGGRLMRTVSFFGCTLAASAGLGGTEPPGVMGLFSAIILLVETKLGLVPAGVKS